MRNFAVLSDVGLGDRALLEGVGWFDGFGRFDGFGWVVSRDLVISMVGVAGAVSVLVLLGLLVRRSRGCDIANWQDAEHVTARWLGTVGCRAVALTACGADGGIDVLTRDWAVQVKHRSGPIGRPAVQQIVGAALGTDRRPAVVSTSGFTAPAMSYANDHDVALVALGLDGRATRMNDSARHIGRRRRAAS